MRGFKRLPKIYAKVRNKKNITIFHLKIDISTTVKLAELYSNDGLTSSAAAMFDKKMLDGTVDHKLMYCEIHNHVHIFI